MNHEQAIDAMGQICSLFPNADLQQAELELFTRQIAKFDQAMLLDVAGQHRLANDWNRPRMSLILTEAERRHAKRHGSPGGASDAPNHAAMIRRNWVANGQPEADDFADAETYFRYHTDLARRYLRGQGLSTSALSKISRECLRDLMQSGVDFELAARCTAAAVNPDLTRSDFQCLLREILDAN